MAARPVTHDPKRDEADERGVTPPSGAPAGVDRRASWQRPEQQSERHLFRRYRQHYDVPDEA
jgi:hypothetical protein